jgi:hypothetical protein
MPTIFELFGLRFFFYADEHSPIHVHIVKGDAEAKIEIDPEIKLIYNHGLKVQDVRRAIRLAKMYKDDIIEIWCRYHDV